jgi:AcrR family transcriptional regulator
MKRIAAELGAATMTLYYYVRNKSDIVALMQDAILADVLVPDECLRGGWREAITAIARRTRDVLMAHPWSLASLNDAQFGPNAMRHFEQSLAAVAGTGLPVPARFELIAATDDYVSGNALHAVESLARARAAEQDPAMVAAAVAYGTAQLRTGDFPQLSAIYAESTRAQAGTRRAADDRSRPDQPVRTRPGGPAGRTRRAHEHQRVMPGQCLRVKRLPPAAAAGSWSRTASAPAGRPGLTTRVTAGAAAGS